MPLFSIPLIDYLFEDLVDALAPLDFSFILDGDDSAHPLSTYSYIGYDPVQIFTPDPKNFQLLRAVLKESAPSNRADFSPDFFCGGLIGFLQYEAGYEFNDMDYPFKKNNPAQILFGYYNKVIVKNLKTNSLEFFMNADDEAEAHNEFSKLKTRLTKKQVGHNPAITLMPLISKDDYIEKIEKVIAYIKAGDIFQANLAQIFESPRPAGFDPVWHYLKMRALNPAPFSSFLNCKDYVISSSSPEQFINLSERILYTSPIKGTIDSAYPKELLQNNDKERAENIMIVDLMRNDFSKICDDDSVTVDSLCSIESFKNLHHMISKISGRLQFNKDIFDVLPAIFPGGSITGAPKMRAMEIIAELEKTPRHIYCGSIGYIDYNGHANFNIAIRTLLIDEHKISLSVGGGITAQSNAADEYEETLIKAKAIMESLL